MMDCHDEGHTTACVMPDEIGLCDVELVHQAQNHLRLGEQRAIEEITAVGIAMAEEIWRDNPPFEGKQRNYLVIEERPGRYSVQKDDWLAIADISPGDPQ